MPGFAFCKWCNGRGCMKCEEERRNYVPTPMFSADRNDPEDMAALKRVFGADNLEKEFGPGGGGMQAIQEQAAIESIKQLLRKKEAP